VNIVDSLWHVACERLVLCDSSSARGGALPPFRGEWVAAMKGVAVMAEERGKKLAVDAAQFEDSASPPPLTQTPPFS
jgi:hypothetical protein